MFENIIVNSSRGMILKQIDNLDDKEFHRLTGVRPAGSKKNLLTLTY